MSVGVNDMRVEGREESYDFFKHFEGGWEGIRQRFGGLIVGGLEQESFKFGLYLSRERGFSPDLLYAVVENRDYSGLDMTRINILTKALGMKADAGFGDCVIEERDLPQLMSLADASGFCFHAPQGMEVRDPRRFRCNAYVRLMALQKGIDGLR